MGKDNQCTSCGGFCGKVCKRLNVVDTMSEKREWVGLTNGEIIGLWEGGDLPEEYGLFDFYAVVRAVQDKLKEKNT